MKPYPAYKPSGVPWVNSLPVDWDIKKVKFLAAPVGAQVHGVRLGTRYVGLEHVRSGVGKYVEATDGMQSEAESTVGVFSKGDVLFGKLRPYLAKSVVADTDGACSTEFLVLRPETDIDPRYLNWALLLEGVIKVIGASTFGAKMPRADWGFISQLALPVPSLDEQRAIASYVDIETEHIGDLVREKEQLIELLREYRQAVIADLTSGVDRPGKKAPTGRAFCPSLPSDWMMVRIGKYSRIGNGSTPLKDNAAFWSGGTFPWLNSAVVNQDAVFNGSEYVTEEALRVCHLPIVEAGAVLVALTGQGKTRGQVTVLRIQATINQHLAFIAPDTERLDPEYLFWTLTGMYDALRMVSDGQGGTKGALTCEDLSRFEIPMPQLTTQREIVQAVAQNIARIDTLIAHASDEIQLLNELRAATIADAVLGRIDVRTASPVDQPAAPNNPSV